jgi:gluconate 5-dehydrogenase
MAEGLAEAGASLMICARREQWLAPTLERFRALGFRIEGMVADVANPAAVQAVVDKTMEAYGQVDILVNNAGITWGAGAGGLGLRTRLMLPPDRANTSLYLVRFRSTCHWRRRHRRTLLGLANGSNLVLSWKTTSAGGPATSQILDVSGSVTLSLSLPIGETFHVRERPAGDVYLQGAGGEHHGREPAVATGDALIRQRLC